MTNSTTNNQEMILFVTNFNAIGLICLSNKKIVHSLKLIFKN